jgi:asparagine synthase (glutamine-hydrolysing)
VYIINKLLKEQKKEELQETFSSVYKSEGTKYCDESQFINTLAQKLNVKSNQIEPKEEEIPNEIEKMIWHLENPQENSLMSSWHTYKLISSTDVKVVLNGQGADEQLAGYLGYIQNYLPSLSLVDLIKESLALLKIKDSWRYVLKGFLIGLYRIIFGDKVLNFTLKKVLKKNFEPDLNKKLAEDIETGLVTLLHYDDHTSMAYSIESRLPFMDYRIVEFLASVPACYKIHNGWTKYLARLAFDGKLPDDIVWRRDKMGWPIPEKTWFEGKLEKWFYDKINSCKICKMLRVSEIPKRFNEKVRMLILSVWEDVFNRSKNG